MSQTHEPTRHVERPHGQNRDEHATANALAQHNGIKRAARILQRSGDPAYAKYVVALRVATSKAAADPERARRIVRQHLAERDSARQASRDPGRFSAPLTVPHYRRAAPKQATATAPIRPGENGTAPNAP